MGPKTVAEARVSLETRSSAYARQVSAGSAAVSFLKIKSPHPRTKAGIGGTLPNAGSDGEAFQQLARDGQLAAIPQVQDGNQGADRLGYSRML